VLELLHSRHHYRKKCSCMRWLKPLLFERSMGSAECLQRHLHRAGRRLAHASLIASRSCGRSRRVPLSIPVTNSCPNASTDVSNDASAARRLDWRLSSASLAAGGLARANSIFSPHWWSMMIRRTRDRYVLASGCTRYTSSSTTLANLKRGRISATQRRQVDVKVPQPRAYGEQ
jgi:hypothetical protein